VLRCRLLFLLAVLVLGAAACSDDDGGGDGSAAATTTALPAASSTTSGPTATTGPAPATAVEARVYFTRDSTVATAGRRVTPPAVAQGAVEALLAGPTEAEAALGLTSPIPAGTELRRISVADGLATVDLSGSFLDQGGPDVALRVAQVVHTLTQFPTVDRVTIQVEGVPAPTVGPDATPVVEVGRGAFEDQAPAVLVESPTPGATVTSPVRVTGTANTFEASVGYEVRSADGTVLDEGFTTATSGTGTRGTFELTTSALPEGEAVLAAFQVSAEDGSRIDVYEVAITVG